MAELAPGTILDGRFEVVSEIGHGGMGVVYRARQLKIGRDVAVKILKSALTADTDKMQRFRREARVVSILDHPNIVQIYAVGIAKDGQPYIAMEYLSGTQLSDMIKERGPLPWRDALRYALQICDGLQYAHEKEIVHRDIKPSNIVLEKYGDDERIKIVDFGIAKPLMESGPALTQTEMVLGSVFYLSPGQFLGRAADARSDVYSVGCTLFEMLVGSPPFTGDTAFDTVHKKTNEAVPRVNQINPKADIPEALQAVLEATLEVDDKKRPASMKELRALLSSVIEGTATDLKAKQPNRPVMTRRMAIRIGLAAFAVLCVCAVGAYFSNAKHHEEPIGPYLTNESRERDIVAQLKGNKGDPQAQITGYYLLGDLYDKYPGLQKEVRRVVETAWGLSPQKVDSEVSDRMAYKLATEYFRLGRFSEAMPLIKQCSEFKTRNAVTFQMGEIAAALGRFDEEYRLVQQLRPSLEAMYNDQVWEFYAMATRSAINSGHYEQALKDLAVYEQMFSENNKARLVETAGMRLVALQEMSKPVSDQVVQKYAQHVSNTDGEYSRPLSEVFLARVLILRGRTDEGLAMIKRAIADYLGNKKNTANPQRTFAATMLLNHIEVALENLSPAERKRFEPELSPLAQFVKYTTNEWKNDAKTPLPVRVVD